MQGHTQCQHLTEKHFTKSVQGRSIYKDQCSYCYGDPRHPGGILLCLTCFNSFCPKQHLQLHLKKRSDHILHLRIEMHEKPVPEGGHEITKVAIGKEGGALGGPEYETKYSLYCSKCNKNHENNSLDKVLDGLVRSVIDSDSAYKKQSLVSWQLEARPCQHTLTLEQEPYNKDLSKCGECELSSNLWLCLTCGHIGCARKNFDGSGGNGHGMEHYNQTKHPIVVKSGTITAQGNASVHCYICDDEVIDQQLAAHLAVLGINVSEQRKTEKTIQQLTLDMNLNLSLSRLVEEGKKMIPAYGPNFTGIDNIGNSCYMNSVIQTLFSLEQYQHQYYDEGLKHIEKCGSMPSECFYCQVAKLADGLLSGKYSQKLHRTTVINEKPTEQEYQEAIRPFDFKMLVAQKNQDFMSSKQQDAQEYFQHLLSKFTKQEKAKKLAETAKVFDFKMVNKLVCVECNGYKLIEQETNQWKFPVPLPTKQQVQLHEAKMKNETDEVRKTKENEEAEYDTTFQKCLELMALGDVVLAHCPNCKKTNTFSSKHLLKSTPKYLFAVSSRFIVKKWVPYKLNALIKMSEKLDLTQFLLQNNKEGGQLLKEGEAAATKAYSEENIKAVQELGFSRNAAIRALSKNQNSVQMASMWIFEHLDDADLNQPIPEEKKGPAGPPADLIEQITSMGFTQEQAKVTLIKYVNFVLNKKNNVEAALGYLFDHEGDVSEFMSLLEQKKQEAAPAGPVHTKYELFGVIVHLGRSVHSGHYVCYLKKDGCWYLYNDHKVCQTDEPVLEKGFLYFFRALA